MLGLLRRVENVVIHIVDPDPNLIDRWNNDRLPLPFFEPCVEQFLRRYQGVSLHFTHETFNSIKNAEIIFVAADIKGKHNGDALDLSKWMRMATLISSAGITQSKIIIDKSRIPIGENRLVEIVNSNSSTTSVQHTVFYIPEFFCSGSIMRDLYYTERVLIGVKSPNQARLTTMIERIYSWTRVDQRLVIDYANHRAVEVATIMTNVFVGLDGIVGNMTASICEAVGADIDITMSAVRRDRRLNGLYTPHGGIGGPGLLRDIKFAVYLCESYHLSHEAMFLRFAILVNKELKKQFIKKMEDTMGTIAYSTIAVLGFAFKELTDDISDSPSLAICHSLLKRGASLRIFDPKVPQYIINGCFQDEAQVEVAKTVEEASLGANAICIPIR